MIAFDVSTLTLVVLLVMIALSLGATVGWILFVIRSARLPAATRLVDVEERLMVTQEALQRKEQELREIDQKIAERDRLAAEAAALREQIEDLRAQLANLAPAREDIEATLKEAAEAAGRLSEVHNEKRHHEQRLAEIADAIKEREQRLAEVDRELGAERIEGLKKELGQAEAELERVCAALEPLRAERDAALRTIADAVQHTARSEALKLESEQLDGARLLKTKQLAELDLKLGTADMELDDMRRELTSVNDMRARALHDRDEAARAQVELSAEARGLQTRIDGLRNELKVLVESLQPGAKGPQSFAPLNPEQRKELLSDLVVQPVCLGSPEQLRNLPIEESEALHHVRTHLRDGGLKFSDRVLRAFHTALKINDSAQITVLAGVSGTGKSLLPRRYAEAMGIHFLQVAVEPRWDSPQDLLGFYNYVEGKYRATELARLMASMDPWQSFGESAPNFRDHVAMVLLDEMNLARVEYYFSEFLSRLEVRPPYLRAWASRTECKDALIPVDIRGLENPPSLFPGQNIMFVGTMNDDESTQSLSDKVLDRGNVMQFPAPTSFPETYPLDTATTRDALRFDSWRSWIQRPSALEGAEAGKAPDVIGRLATIMDEFGKPFGHRMNQSIRHYVANYPSETAALDIDAALVDQVEFRILPKLRGVEISNHGVQFDALEALVGNTLGDTALGERIHGLREEQEQRTGQFVWRGLERG